MCGKSVTSSVMESDQEDQNNQLEEEDIKMESDSDSGTATPKKGANTSEFMNNFGKIRKNETPEEKLKRRKLERKKRVLARRQAQGLLGPATSSRVTKKVMQAFGQVWDTESAFVTQLMQCLPEVKQPGILLDDEKRTDEYVNVPRGKGKEENDEEKEKKLSEKFFAKVKRNLKQQGVETTAERASSYMELKERLHRKMAELAQRPNLKKREKKLKKKEARAKEEKSNKGKKLISQSASSTASAAAGATVNGEDNSAADSTKKTPLKKKPVVKSNGEIVYSKFDFISGTTDQNFSEKNKKGPAKPSAEELLKQVEKHETKISKLETSGKKTEAVSLEENKKWEAALRRAEGQKVRDDPNLLKKTIKKMGKQKQLTKRKWKERVERVEKMKEQRQQKRQANIQSKKDDKKKRVKKIMRKRGRIA